MEKWLNEVSRPLIRNILFADHVAENGHPFTKADWLTNAFVRKCAEYARGVNMMALCIAITAVAYSNGLLNDYSLTMERNLAIAPENSVQIL